MKKQTMFKTFLSLSIMLACSLAISAGGGTFTGAADLNQIAFEWLAHDALTPASETDTRPAEPGALGGGALLFSAPAGETPKLIDYLTISPLSMNDAGALKTVDAWGWRHADIGGGASS